MPSRSASGPLKSIPEFGNPYNDIGAYLIELDRFNGEAIPWLERAAEAARYDPRHFPHNKQGRAYLGKEMYAKARNECFQQALEIEPRYALARDALDSLAPHGQLETSRPSQAIGEQVHGPFAVSHGKNPSTQTRGRPACLFTNPPAPVFSIWR